MYDHKTGFIRSGNILTVDDSKSYRPVVYRVQFNNIRVPSQLCSDLQVVVHGTPEYILWRARPGDAEDRQLLEESLAELRKQRKQNRLLRSTVWDEYSIDSNECFPYPFDVRVHPQKDKETATQIKGIALLARLLIRQEMFVSALRSLNETAQVAVTKHLLASPLTTAPPIATSDSTNGTSNSLYSHVQQLQQLQIEQHPSSTPKFSSSFASQFQWLKSNIEDLDKSIDHALSLLKESVIRQAQTQAQAQSQATCTGEALNTNANTNTSASGSGNVSDNISVKSDNGMNQEENLIELFKIYNEERVSVTNILKRKYDQKEFGDLTPYEFPLSHNANMLETNTQNNLESNDNLNGVIDTSTNTPNDNETNVSQDESMNGLKERNSELDPLDELIISCISFLKLVKRIYDEKIDINLHTLLPWKLESLLPFLSVHNEDKCSISSKCIRNSLKSLLLSLPY